MISQRIFLPGFRFYPTEEELLGFYLPNMLANRREDMEKVIPVTDVYGFDPWQLAPVSGVSCGDISSEQWFFFCSRQEREARGGKPSRTMPSGYWKATGSPSLVYGSNNRVIGGKRTMVFYQGRVPSGTKTKWKMNEYRALADDATPNTTPGLRNEFSLCRVYINTGIIRSFDRRPSVTPDVASTSNVNPLAADSDDSRITAAGGSASGRAEPVDIDWDSLIESLERTEDCLDDQDVVSPKLVPSMCGHLGSFN